VASAVLNCDCTLLDCANENENERTKGCFLNFPLRRNFICLWHRSKPDQVGFPGGQRRGKKSAFGFILKDPWTSTFLQPDIVSYKAAFFDYDWVPPKFLSLRLSLRLGKEETYDRIGSISLG